MKHLVSSSCSKTYLYIGRIVVPKTRLKIAESTILPGEKKFPENEFLSTTNHHIKHILERTCANNAPLKISRSRRQE